MTTQLTYVVSVGKAHASALSDIRALRSEDAGRAARESLGADALFVATDVRDEAAIVRLVRRTLERFGRLDITFNCAGAEGDMAPLERTDQALWDDVMAINARGVWLAMRHEIPARSST